MPAGDYPLLKGLPPIIADNCRVLVLGSMPGVKSLEGQRYYAHPRNVFWKIVSELTAASSDDDYLLRCEALRAAGIGLWDVVEKCKRPGSLDSNIDKKTITINKINNLIKVNNNIRAVCLNGGTADSLFRALVLPGLNVKPLPAFIKLPSTSPANASWSFASKREVWLSNIRPYLD